MVLNHQHQQVSGLPTQLKQLVAKAAVLAVQYRAETQQQLIHMCKQLQQSLANAAVLVVAVNHGSET